MNHASTYPVGHYQNAPKAKAKTIAQTARRVRRLDAETKRRRPSSKRQTPIRTPEPTAHGFLKCQFLPKLKISETAQACKKSSTIERNFYKSLSHLAKHYGIEPMPTQDFEFPYNLALAVSDAEEKLKKKILDWEEIRLVQDGKKTYFVSEERYDTKATLYYIPVAPLYRLCRLNKTKASAELLISVCAYLYHIAGIPYYRQESSYLFWMYEMMQDWIEQDDDTQENKRFLSEIKQADFIGDFIEKKIYNLNNLNYFKERIDKFKINDVSDKDVLKVAKEAYSLFETYPEANIFRNAKTYGEPTEEDMENTICMEKYISFSADHKGWLCERLIESVNMEFQECTIMKEPIILKHFDGRDIPTTNLCFENRIFGLMSNLIDILNEY